MNVRQRDDAHRLPDPERDVVPVAAKRRYSQVSEGRGRYRPDARTNRRPRDRALVTHALEHALRPAC
jgi:hypothetical protein